MPMRQMEVYAKNASDVPQIVRHPLLRQMTVVPVMPGGYALVANMQITLQPGQCIRLPMHCWNTGPSLMRRPWLEKIPLEEFLAAGIPMTIPTPEPIPLYDFEGKRVVFGRRTAKRVYFTDEGGSDESWTSIEKWDANAQTITVSPGDNGDIEP